MQRYSVYVGGNGWVHELVGIQGREKWRLRGTRVLGGWREDLVKVEGVKMSVGVCVECGWGVHVDVVGGIDAWSQQPSLVARSAGIPYQVAFRS